MVSHVHLSRTNLKGLMLGFGHSKHIYMEYIATGKYFYRWSLPNSQGRKKLRRGVEENRGINIRGLLTSEDPVKTKLGSA